MLNIFDKTYRHLMFMTEADFSYVTTHDYEKKEQVKHIQNEFITQRVPKRDEKELMLCLVGNPEGLEAHLQEYNSLGFNNPGQVIVVERQTQTAKVLIDKAIELGYKTSRDNPLPNDPSFFKELKIYNTSINLNDQNLGLRGNEQIIPLITHIDFDGTDPGYTESSIVQNINSIFSHSNVKSAVLVYTVSRSWGGLETQTTASINSEIDNILNQNFTCSIKNSRAFTNWASMGFRTKFVRNTLEEFMRLAATYHLSQRKDQITGANIAVTVGGLKRTLKQIVARKSGVTSTVNSAYEDILKSIKNINGVSAKIIPYTGKANMFSITAVRDNSNTTELDLSLKNEEPIQKMPTLIKGLCKKWPLNEIIHSTTKQPLLTFLQKEYATQ